MPFQDESIMVRNISRLFINLPCLLGKDGCAVLSCIHQGFEIRVFPFLNWMSPEARELSLTCTFTRIYEMVFRMCHGHWCKVSAKDQSRILFLLLLYYNLNFTRAELILSVLFWYIYSVAINMVGYSKDWNYKVSQLKEI